MKSSKLFVVLWLLVAGPVGAQTLVGVAASPSATDLKGRLDIASPPAFDFNFAGANGLREVTDLTGKAKCLSAVPLAVENGALHVDYGARISIPAQYVPMVNGNFTLCAWVLNSRQGAFGIQGYNPVVSKGLQPGGQELDLGLRDGCPSYTYRVAGSSNLDGLAPIGSSYGGTVRYPDPQSMKSDPVVKDGIWTHLAIVRDKDTVRIFEDGQLVLERSGLPHSIAATAQPLYIGAELTSGESDNLNTANMSINDVRMYGGALPDASIAAIYAAEKGGYPTKPIELGSLRNYYPPEMQEFSYDLDNKLKVVETYEKKIPADPYIGLAAMTSKVDSSIKPSQLWIDGKPVYPLACMPSIGYFNPQSATQSTRMTRDFAAAGVNLLTIDIGYPAMFWLGPGNYKWDKVDQTFNAMIAANPKAQILAEAYFTVPGWFAKAYPEELEQYYYNDDLPSAGLRRWAGSAPLASEKWQEMSCDAIGAFVRHIESQPYANHICGYHLASGDAGEWYWAASFTGGMPGYSVATRNGFRKWLRITYHNDEAALRMAWHDPTATFDSVVVPSPAQRKATERWAFRDADKARSVFDFRQYMNDTTLALVARSTRAAKEACGWRKTVSIYYGYSLLFAGKGATLQKGGIANLSDVMALDSVDMMATPVDYVERRGGQPGMNINAFTASARLHNKIVWREEDLRTHFWPRFEFGRASDTHESVGVIERDFGHSLTNQGTGLWYTAMAGNAAFHQNAMMDSIASIARVAGRAVKADRSSVAQVALIFDENSLMHLAVQTNPFIDSHCWGTYANASMMGAPFDCYLLDDLDRIRPYKLYIFVDAYAPDAATIEAIARKVRQNNAVSVWCFAPGYITDKGFNVDNMARLTGINLHESLAQESCALVPTTRAHAITKYAGNFPTYTFGPGFSVADDRATVLGTANGQPALAVAEFNQHTPAMAWRSVYSLMPLTKELLMGLCDYAGVHVYSRSFDVFSANASYIMMHAVNAGNKEIDLPGNRDVSNALTGVKLVAGSTKILDMMPAKETRIYQLTR